MLNSINLVGRLCRDPELKYTPSGTAICTLSLATNESYKDSNGQRVEETQYHTVNAFSKQAEASAKYLIKGQEVIVTGRLVYRRYDDDKFKNEAGESVRRVLARIVAQRVTFGSKPRGSSDQANSAEDIAEAANALDASGGSDDNTPVDDDLPF